MRQCATAAVRAGRSATSVGAVVESSPYDREREEERERKNEEHSDQCEKRRSVSL